MSRIVMDAGGLIALERNQRQLWAALADAATSGGEVVVPSTVLAQVWRGTARQARLARALMHCRIATFDPIARSVGELCGLARTSDVCDAHVALVSVDADAVYTSDPTDIRRLLLALRLPELPNIVRC